MTPARLAQASTMTAEDEINDLFARLLELLGDAGELGADITVKLHRPVPAALMECVREAIESPGFRFTGPLAEAIGHSGSATVSVLAEIAPGGAR
ncbi:MULTISPECIES: hypothetical protein [Streptomyces]|uniref:hypothetical protein n=1 Tax=Streptomyces TaxID=1883 RepID=UPI00345C36B3